MAGPLQGIRVIEVAGIGPGPFAAMMLSDMGAEVVRVDRAQAVRALVPDPGWDLLQRGRRNIALDLKHPDGTAALLRLVERADALIEGFRPGVMERLGLGPDACLARNPRLVFGRMTGWGQDGPYALAAGHDVNYIALAGALAHFGRHGEPPTPPLNMVADFGGGGMMLAFGVVCALLETQRSGQGQVVDAAMVDGAALLMTMFWGMRQRGLFDEEHRGENLLDTGAHFYEVYRCADGRYVSIGSIEPQFYAAKFGWVALPPQFRIFDDNCIIAAALVMYGRRVRRGQDPVVRHRLGPDPHVHPAHRGRPHRRGDAGRGLAGGGGPGPPCSAARWPPART